MRFFNLGASELLLIAVFAILAVGPKETIKLFNQGREILSSIQGVISELTSEVSNIAKEVVETPEEKSSTK
jgi:Sec-independent protein translocase protein TatA